MLDVSTKATNCQKVILFFNYHLNLVEFPHRLSLCHSVFYTCNYIAQCKDKKIDCVLQDVCICVLF